eukprot:963780_1
MGVWNGSDAVCQPLEDHCDRLSPPVNGMIALTNRRINGEASLTCNLGYFMSGGSQEIMPVNKMPTGLAKHRCAFRVALSGYSTCWTGAMRTWTRQPPRTEFVVVYAEL